MSTPVNLPALGESVTEGTVTRWLKQVGDQVAVDEPLLEVSTDKVDTEIPSPVAGTLLEIKAAEDETVEVGAELCVVGDEGESGGSGSGEDRADVDPSAGAESGASNEPEDSGDRDGDRKTETETAPPAARTEEAPPAQETSSSSSDTRQEAEASGAGSEGGGGGGTSVTLPALGESVTEGTVTRWLKQVGDEVAVDEPLLEVSTDKVDTEIPSPVAGTLLEIKADEDETVEVGAELALVGSGTPDGAGAGSSQTGAPAEDATPQAPHEAEDQGAAPEDQRTAQGSQSTPSEPEPRPNQPRTGDQPEQPPAPMTRQSPAGQPGGSTG